MAKKRKTTKEHTPKEIYLSYYWLVTNLIITPDPYETFIGLGYPRMPKCLSGAMEEVSEGQIRSYTANKLFTWLLKKDIPFLHTRDDQPIACLTDLRRLWEELKIEPIALTTFQEKAKHGTRYYFHCVEEEYRKRYEALEAYLSEEHRKNLKKLEAEAGVIVEFEGKTFVLNKEEYITKEIYTMMGVVPSTFSGYKNIPNFPEPINPEEIPHKYTLEAVVEMFPLVEAKRANPNKKIPSNRRKRKKTTKKHRRT